MSLQHESGAKAAENFLLRGKLRETEAALAAAQHQLKETLSQWPCFTPPTNSLFGHGARKGDDEINPRARMGLSHHLLSLVRPNVNLW